MMFENLSFRGFTWPKEPVLYLTLLVAILNVAISLITGDVSWGEAIDTVIILIGGFVARGQVTPVA